MFIPCALARVASRLPDCNIEFLASRSPVTPCSQTPVTFLQHVFRPGESVLIFDDFRSQGRQVWTCEPGTDPHGLDHFIHGHADGVWFLCNPVDGLFHANPRLGGKTSRRSEESITAWRYLVLESDKADSQQWLAALAQMPLRISAIYTSGGRSIHALIRLDAASKKDWDAKAARLKPALTILGADPAAMTAVRLTRLPGCYRGEAPAASSADSVLGFDSSGDPDWSVENIAPQKPPPAWAGGRLQQLLYLDPNPTGTPICRRAARRDCEIDSSKNFQPKENSHVPA